jgi:hypothetical protein
MRKILKTALLVVGGVVVAASVVGVTQSWFTDLSHQSTVQVTEGPSGQKLVYQAIPIGGTIEDIEAQAMVPDRNVWLPGEEFDMPLVVSNNSDTAVVFRVAMNNDQYIDYFDTSVFAVSDTAGLTLVSSGDLAADYATPTPLPEPRYYFGFLNPQTTVNLSVHTAISHHFSTEADDLFDTTLQTDIRVDACQGTDIAVRDYFGFKDDIIDRLNIDKTPTPTPLPTPTVVLRTVTPWALAPVSATPTPQFTHRPTYRTPTPTPIHY